MKQILAILLVFIFSNLQGQNCSTINTDFDSYESALKIIKSYEFKFSESCNTKKSSWIYNAEYFSCNKKTGFLLIKTKSKTYIHKEVPIETWNNFKKAESFGKYYSKNIKSHYRLVL